MPSNCSSFFNRSRSALLIQYPGFHLGTGTAFLRSVCPLLAQRRGRALRRIDPSNTRPSVCPALLMSAYLRAILPSLPTKDVFTCFTRSRMNFSKSLCLWRSFWIDWVVSSSSFNPLRWCSAFLSSNFVSYSTGNSKRWYSSSCFCH